MGNWHVQPVGASVAWREEEEEEEDDASKPRGEQGHDLKHSPPLLPFTFPPSSALDRAPTDVDQIPQGFAKRSKNIQVASWLSSMALTSQTGRSSTWRLGSYNMYQSTCSKKRFLSTSASSWEEGQVPGVQTEERKRSNSCRATRSLQIWSKKAYRTSPWLTRREPPQVATGKWLLGHPTTHLANSWPSMNNLCWCCWWCRASFFFLIWERERERETMLWM